MNKSNTMAYTHGAVVNDYVLVRKERRGAGSDAKLIAVTVFEIDSFGVSSTYEYDSKGNMVRIEWFKNDELLHIDHFLYELQSKPIFNYWLHINRFFPEWMRYEV